MPDFLPTIEADNGTLLEATPVVLFDEYGNLYKRVSISDAEGDAANEGRAYLASSSLQRVTKNQKLVVCFYNPPDSGVNLHLMRRLFGTTQKVGWPPCYYQAFGNPTFEPANTVPSLKRKGGGDPSLTKVAWEVVNKNTVIGGFDGSSEPIPTGGQTRERAVETVTPPGGGAAYVVYGVGSAFDATVTLEWWEAPLTE